MQGSARITPRWLKLALGGLCVAAVVAAVLVVGPAGAPASNVRLVTAQRGVVQSTVSGSGTIEGASQENVNFSTSGRLAHVFVSVGQHVVAGQLLAQLDPTQAQLNLDQADANLSSADAKLAQAESGSSAGGAPGAGTGSGAATAASTGPTASAATVTIAAVAHRRTQGKAPSRGQHPTSSAPTSQRPSGSGTSGGSTQRGSSQQGGSSSSGAQSAQATAASIAAAQATVDGAQAAVSSAQATLNDTSLRAAAAGTVASISAQAGETVSGGGSAAASAGSGPSSSNGSSGSGGSGAGGGGGAAGGGASGGSSSGSSSSGSSSSSAFIVLVDTSAFQLKVPFTESDISKVHVGQPATVTVNALPGEQLAAHVTSIDMLPTTNSGVVSYGVTFQLDQSEADLRPGMTASAQVVVSQVGDAVSVPSAAVSRRGGTATVTVIAGGKPRVQPVVTGMTGDSTTQIISGVNAGQQVQLQVAASAATGAAGVGRGGAGAGLLGGGGGFGGGGRFGGGGGGLRLGGGG